MTISFHIVALFFDTPIGYLILAQIPLILYHGNNACGRLTHNDCIDSCSVSMIYVHRELRRLIWAQLKNAFTCACCS